MSVLDQAIGFFSPETALRRHSARQRWNLARNYDAAGGGERISGWDVGKSVNSDADLRTLRGRARDLCRNNPYAATAVRTLTSYVVGGGIKPHSNNDQVEDALKRWADTSECDAQGEQNLYGLQTTIFKHLMIDGEVFIQKVIDPKKDIPLRLRVLEAEYLDENRNKINGVGNQIYQGIEYNKAGERVAYYILAEHPDQATTFRALKSKRIPAADIVHLYRKDQAAQARGVTFFAPVMIRMKDFDEYEDATLLKAKLQNCFVGFFRDLEAQGDDPFENGGGVPKDLTPGSILNAPSGQTIEFSNPPQSSGYAAYAEASKQTIAVGLGIPYMLMSGDYSKANYSSSRMSMLNFYRYVDQLTEHLMVPRLCNRIEQWFVEVNELTGGSAVERLIWTSPKKEMTDPDKDVEAFQKAVSAGFMSHAEVIRQMGDDPEDTYEEIANINKLFDKNKFVFTTDGRHASDGNTEQNTKQGGNVPPKNNRPGKANR